MAFIDKLKQLTDNTFFMYFIVFLAFTNVVGYLILNNSRAIIFFILASAIAYMFSSNWTIILLVAILLTNTFMTTRSYEGFDNSDATTIVKTDINEDQIIDQDIKNGIKVMKKNNLEQATQQLKESNNNIISDDGPIMHPSDPNNVELNMPINEVNAPTPSEINTFRPMNKAGMKNRIDYASTLEEAYNNLESILGQGGIKQLTNDTQNLMHKQKELFKSMEGMSPLLNQAKELLSGFNMQSLQGVTGMATPVAP